MGRNVTGRNYDMQKVMKLYESGWKPSEIAKRLNINSVQSLGHAIERHNRERRKQKESFLKLLGKSRPRKRKNRKSWKMK